MAMVGEADLARIGALIGDRTRAAMLLMLLAGRPRSASDLATAAGVSAPLASMHLRKLVDGGLLVVEPAGRQRLFRLANAVADALEGLLLLAPPASVDSLRAAVSGRRLRWARLCYDHLAGTVGVAIRDGLVAGGHLAPGAAGMGRAPSLGSDGNTMDGITPAGAGAFGALGIDVAALDRRRRPLARRCMDWSERRDHLAGSLGAALLSRLLELGWLRTREASRVVTLTAEGHAGLRGWLGIAMEGPE